MISYLLPTHNRPERLRQTLDAIARLERAGHESIGGAEVIVIDNASEPPVTLPAALKNGWPLRLIRRATNEGAAARNAGVNLAHGEWIVMLDDDSYPLDDGHIEVLLDAPVDVAAIGGDIVLPNGDRESGGLPEVIIGCGAAIRRAVFLDVGGYDPAFDYYAEEYDLCAKLLLSGWRVIHDHRFRVRHEKVAAGRDMNRILHRLVRNNCWILQRYAPSDCREREIGETIARYAQIAMKENAACGFAAGMADLLRTIPDQPRREMPHELYGRFTGFSYAHQALSDQLSRGIHEAVAVVDRGKNAAAIDQALGEIGCRIVDDERHADWLVIGSLSPGPMLDAFERRSGGHQPVLLPWRPLNALSAGKTKLRQTAARAPARCRS